MWITADSITGRTETDVLIHQTVQPSNLMSNCLSSHFNTKLVIRSSLSLLSDQSDSSLHITGSYFREPGLHLVTMWSLYRPEPAEVQEAQLMLCLQSMNMLDL